MSPEEIPDEVVAAAKRADHDEGVQDGRSFIPVPDHQVRRLIAGAVAAERDRLSAQYWEQAAGLVEAAKATAYGDGVRAERERIIALILEPS